MKIEMTEELWDILNPRDTGEIGEEFGTAWMFSDDEYFSIFRMECGKVFGYHNPNLHDPYAFVIDKMFHTAGTLTVEDDYITHKTSTDIDILYNNKIIPFKKKK